MNLELATRLTTMAVEKAKADYGRPICVAVCDRYGFLLAFVRMDGAPVRGIRIAQGKAYTSARLGSDTAAFQERLRREGLAAGDFCDEGLTAMPGGCVVKGQDGAVIGAIGISGLAPSEDAEIGKAMAALAATLA